MLTSSQYGLIAGLVLTFAALVAYISAVVASQQALTAVARARRAKVLVGADGHPIEDLDGSALPSATTPPAAAQAAVRSSSAGALARVASLLTWGGLTGLTVCLVLRAVATGHGPFVSQYEFSVSTAWGMVAAFLFFEWRYHARTLSLLVLPIALATMLYALTNDSTVDPLVPALQNSFLLTTHIIVAVFAYGAFAVSAAAAFLYLFTPSLKSHLVPKPEVLDRLGYRAVVIGFPLLTMVIVLGAVWAEIAWGTYWSWDPKETASLVTWLIYGGYLHARVARGWVGKPAAALLLVGFASVIFTFVGVAYFTGGLHSYGVTK